MPLYIPSPAPGSMLSGIDGDDLTTGQETYPRRLGGSLSLSVVSSGALNVTAFTARKSETITQVKTFTGSQAAAATPTICRVGIYSMDASANGTLIASTPNDTAMWATTATAYTKALSVGVALVQGTRYAVGLLCVNAGAVPNIFCLSAGATTNDLQTAPYIASRSSGGAYADLPASFTAANVASNANGIFYTALLP